MPVEFRGWIERDDLRADPEKLFVFGDNLEHYGMGGQAKSMRGEPNAIGLPTKRNPGVYLKDDDLPEVIQDSAAARMKLIDHVRQGGTVVWPLNGIGTGLSRLDERAPTIFAFWQEFMDMLANL